MTPEMMEKIWMMGCTGVMVILGLVALVGYLKHKQRPEERFVEAEDLDH